MARCKGCGQEIIWVKALSGKSIPCDPKPIPYVEDLLGNVTIVSHDGYVVKAHIFSDGDDECDGFGYFAHFATCPQADRFRRKQ